MPHNLEIAQVSDRVGEKPVNGSEIALDVAPPVSDAPARVDQTGVELKRGAFLNTIASLASNFRGIFTFLVARLLGPVALGCTRLRGRPLTSLARSVCSASTMPSPRLSLVRKLSATGHEVGRYFESL
jgi:hypothetical protein